MYDRSLGLSTRREDHRATWVAVGLLPGTLTQRNECSRSLPCLLLTTAHRPAVGSPRDIISSPGFAHPLLLASTARKTDPSLLQIPTFSLWRSCSVTSSDTVFANIITGTSTTTIITTTALITPWYGFLLYKLKPTSLWIDASHYLRQATTESEGTGKSIYLPHLSSPRTGWLVKTTETWRKSTQLRERKTSKGIIISEESAFPPGLSLCSSKTGSSSSEKHRGEPWEEGGGRSHTVSLHSFSALLTLHPETTCGQ